MTSNECPTIEIRNEPLVERLFDRQESDPDKSLEDPGDESCPDKFPNKYNIALVTHNSEDNTDVPMLIVQHKDIINDGQSSSSLSLYGDSKTTEWTPINLNWSKKILELVGNKAKLMESFSWLSTVGGGFSALGEGDSKWSARAGTLSLGQQLHLAELLGDERLKVMCHLFAALAALQMNNKQFCFNYIKRVILPLINAMPYRDVILINILKHICFRMSTQFVGHQQAIEQADNKENQTPRRTNRTTNKIITATKVSRNPL